VKSGIVDQLLAHYFRRRRNLRRCFSSSLGGLVEVSMESQEKTLVTYSPLIYAGLSHMPLHVSKLGGSIVW